MLFKPRFALLLAPLALLACETTPEVPAEVRPWPASASCPAPAGAGLEARALEGQINALRGTEGLEPLRLDPALSAVAQRYACESAARGALEAKGSDGSTLAERLARSGLSGPVQAELRAQGATAAEVFALWSEGADKRRLLNKDVTTLGIGLTGGYWVAVVLQP